MTDQLQTKTVNCNWRTAFFVLLTVLIVAVGFLIYGIVDQAITLTYMKEGYKDTEADLAVLSRLTPTLKRGMSQKDILSLLREQNPKIMIVEENNSIWIGQLTFHFNNNQLSEIKQK